MRAASRLTSKCQVTVPREIRDALHVGAGDLVHFTMEEGRAVLRSAPESYTEALAGMGREVFGKLGGAERFLAEERESWR
jgi:AbrB family looped-hinge helix DNA binding protein